MIDYQKDLNEEQFRAVTEGDGYCLVLAGAGSGKTRTIIYRVAYLLEKGVSPENILLLTFTNKAAREMIERAKSLLGEEKFFPWAGTFHSVANRILRQHPEEIGYKKNFTILDSGDSLDVMKTCFKSAGIDRKDRRFPSPQVFAGILSFARNSEKPLSEVLDEKNDHWLGIAADLENLADDYSRRKISANAMDFDDLLVNWRELLTKNSELKKKYSETFRYILVDEYQDTNRVQAAIINLLARENGNLLVVGDDAQSIYSFRAAEIENILDFKTQYPDAKIFKLETNYRSTPDILRVANKVIEKNFNQHQKTLRSVLPPHVPPCSVVLSDGKKEAEYVAEKILELRGDGMSLRDIAVLFRAAFHSQMLEMELTKRGISYEYRGGLRFFERAHIKDAVAFLRIFHNQKDEVAWNRVLNMQPGIGPSAAIQIISLLKSIQSPDWSLPEENKDFVSWKKITNGLSPRYSQAWNGFLSICAKITLEPEFAPARMIQALLESPFVDFLRSEYQDYRERVEDLKQLAYFAGTQKDLAHFLSEVSLQENYSLFGRQKEDGKDRLVLSTVHQAKGLEWQAVFIINLLDGQFPHDRAIREGGLEEERRLFYVAITRAKKMLFLTHSLYGGFGSASCNPSVFLSEAEMEDDDSDEVSYEPIDGPVAGKKGFLKDIEDL